ncbi:MAG: DUF1330 domain-containing protein [Paracoccus sp. (in: a-proteobacteria)]
MSKPAYFILEIDIQDAEGMKPYLAGAGATLEPYHSTPLVHGNTIDAVEGEAPQGKIVILRFDSMELARAWYASPEYRELLPHRLRSAHNRAYFVEGLEA